MANACNTYCINMLYFAQYLYITVKLDDDNILQGDDAHTRLKSMPIVCT
jgi:hypothetical protein